MLGEVTYRSSRMRLITRIGPLAVAAGAASWINLAKGGWAILGGSIFAVLFAAIAFVLVARLVKPSRLVLSDEGFAWKTAFSRRGVRERWSDLADVGAYTKQRLIVVWSVRPETLGLGYRLKSSVLSGKRERQAMQSLGLTGWHGVVTDDWDVSTHVIVEAFQRYLDAARGSKSRSITAPSEDDPTLAEIADKVRTLNL